MNLRKFRVKMMIFIVKLILLEEILNKINKPQLRVIIHLKYSLE